MRMRLVRQIAIVSVLLLSACRTISETDDLPDVDRSGTVLFEIEYVNYAWVPTWKGYYVDSGGSVFSYDRSADRTSFPTDKTEYTHEELIEKLSVKRAHVRELPMSDVLK